MRAECFKSFFPMRIARLAWALPRLKKSSQISLPDGTRSTCLFGLRFRTAGARIEVEWGGCGAFLRFHRFTKTVSRLYIRMPTRRAFRIAFDKIPQYVLWSLRNESLVDCAKATTISISLPTTRVSEVTNAVLACDNFAFSLVGLVRTKYPPSACLWISDLIILPPQTIRFSPCQWIHYSYMYTPSYV